MRRKIIILCILLLALSFSAEAAQQPPKIPRVGFISGTGDPQNPGPQIVGFREGLRKLGYLEGKNILVEYRYAEGKSEATASLAVELVQLKVDVLVTGTAVGIQAAKKATKTIPIVMVILADPVELGIVDSLAHPGGNITGLATITRELGGKRLELLNEVVPKMSSIGVLWDKASPSAAIGFKEYEAWAWALRIQIQSLEVRGPNPDLEGAFQGGAKEGVRALITIRGPLLNRYPKQIADLAIRNHLPSIYEGPHYVEAGGLMSYGSNDTATWSRAAYYVDKILKGAKPAALPVEQPRKIELVINLKTAKQIGLTIPPDGAVSGGQGH